MPSEDKTPARANAWLKEDLHPSVVQAHDAPRLPRKLEVSGFIQKLAKRMGVKSADLAARFPSDTVRRTKYPVIEQAQPDGSTKYVQSPAGPDGQRRSAR